LACAKHFHTLFHLILLHHTRILLEDEIGFVRLGNLTIWLVNCVTAIITVKIYIANEVTETAYKPSNGEMKSYRISSETRV
jgi:hypothetical protein